MQTVLALRYHLMVYRREQLWLPVALWGLFALLVALFRSQAKVFDIAGGFLGIVLPLIGGILAASTLLDDPALELQMVSPRRPWRTLLERLGMIFLLVACTALAFQVLLAALDVDVSVLGNLAVRQLVWIAPSMALFGLASLVALASKQSIGGVLAVGLVWLVQLLLRDWFMANRWARFVFLFIRSRFPRSPDLFATEACLAGLALVFTVGAALLTRKEERYL